ncbi:Myb-like DNA-binding domain containing protein [Tritrichomonas foetus]|uniref:Myb-like DNA-binding domain containing protein n=1 Tax=Tritrichomonas foetus TaxID=1144522 RepID=A0A1J4JXF2_9EUKA|nr:Myb-like DNA-binding domain containing protein [Tritrichomonas foetus]|eukprot:OHT03833.1 Myb-like DNA-binding domain containing protein [Tritrichomonas foetus]
MLLNNLANYSPKKQQKPHIRCKFTQEEDEHLQELVEKYGINDWVKITSEMEGRNIRQCRERWQNYLSPDICNEGWTTEDDQKLWYLVSTFGLKWSVLSHFFPNRTYNNVRNRWKKELRKRKLEMKRLKVIYSLLDPKLLKQVIELNTRKMKKAEEKAQLEAEHSNEQINIENTRHQLSQNGWYDGNYFADLSPFYDEEIDWE